MGTEDSAALGPAWGRPLGTAAPRTPGVTSPRFFVAVNNWSKALPGSLHGQAHAPLPQTLDADSSRSPCILANVRSDHDRRTHVAVVDGR